ncbi:MAG: hypothetical protein PF904_16545 [Kiritimatiellae bacterium]|nr:hypothetical protein [Kiritimatiellia bacterium]
MKKFKVLRFMLGLTLLPICIAATLSVLEAINAANSSSSMFSKETIALFSGYLVWLGIWFFLPRPAKSYILAHELTHAISGFLFGAKVSNLNVSSKGGSVSLTKTNLWIILSPYFIPFYTIIIIVAYLITGIFINPVPLKLLWVFLVGFTWSFHACFTLNSLMIRQPDIHMYGRIFSYVIIYCLNLAVVALWMIFTTEVSAAGIYESLQAHTISIYTLLYHQGIQAVNTAIRVVKRLSM